jgi:uncharacterized protein (TIGR03437 family)
MYCSRKALVFRIGFVLSAAMSIASVGQAYEFGPPAGYTGAPGDNKTSCIAAGCHAGTVNSGSGGVKIVLPNGTAYTPGQAETVSVQITDATKVKFGFEMTARLASNPAIAQAGDFTTGSDGLTQVICADDSNKKNGGPCPSLFPVQFIEHTINGYHASTKGGYTFTFTWTPPAASAGNVILYVAANAGPGDPPATTPTNVYTTNVTLTPGSASTAPTINPNGVVPIFSSSTSIEPGSWISIYGDNLASATSIWNGDFPISLGGVSVTVNSKPAYIWFVGPSQINVQAPDDTGTGSVNVVVTNESGSATSTAVLSQFSPTFSLLDATHPAGVLLTPNGSGAYGGGTYDLLGPPGAFSFNTRAVRKGEVVELFGTGFGPTNPAVPAGKLFSGAAPAANPVTVTVGGIAQTLTAYEVGAGLYQINVAIPSNSASGEIPLQATAGGVQTPATVRITVQ